MWNGALSRIQGDREINVKPDINWNIGSGDFIARPHPTKLPNYEEKLKDSVGLGMVVHDFNPSTYGTEANRSLNSRPVWLQNMLQDTQV